MHKIQFTRLVPPYLNGEIASFDDATAGKHVQSGRAVYVGGDVPAAPAAPVTEVTAPVEAEVPAGEVEIEAAVSETPADKMLTTGRAGRPRR